jgi:hypothetical protein
MNEPEAWRQQLTIQAVKPKIGTAGQVLLRRWLEEQPDLTLAELQVRPANRHRCKFMFLAFADGSSGWDCGSKKVAPRG